MWDAATGTLQRELKGHTSGVTGAVFSFDGTRIATGSLDSTARVWNASTGDLELELKGHTLGVSSVAFSPDGKRIVTGSLDRTAKVWDAQTGASQFELTGHTGPVECVAFSPDGVRIVTGGGENVKPGEVKVWDARAGRPPTELRGSATTTAHLGFSVSAAFSPDSRRIVTLGADRVAKVWDTETGSPQLELKGRMDQLECVAFSPDGTRIVTASRDTTAMVWDARTGTLQQELKGHKWVESVAFSPDGARIVTGSMDKTVKVWDATTGMLQLELNGPPDLTRGAVTTRVAFSPDGTRVVAVTGNFDRTAKVWDTRTGLELPGEPIPALPGPAGVSPDGRFIAHPTAGGFELIPMQPDAEELAYRQLQMRPNKAVFSDSFQAARAARDDFAAQFYLKLLPPSEQQYWQTWDVARRDLAAGRPEEALVKLATLSSDRPKDDVLALWVASLQAWFGQEKELAATRARILAAARNTQDAGVASSAAKACCLVPSASKAEVEAALALARTGVELERMSWTLLSLGMTEYRNADFAAADRTLVEALEWPGGDLQVRGIAAFYRAMSLFRQGKPDEARKLATEAAVKMRPLPKDDKNPLAGDADYDDLILWLAYKEAKALIKFDAAPTALPLDPPPREKK